MKGYALQESRSTAGSRKLWNRRLVMKVVTERNILHGTKGDADYLSTLGTKGNRWKHFGNQGRQSDT